MCSLTTNNKEKLTSMLKGGIRTPFFQLSLKEVLRVAGTSAFPVWVWPAWALLAWAWPDRLKEVLGMAGVWAFPVGVWPAW